MKKNYGIRGSVKKIWFVIPKTWTGLNKFLNDKIVVIYCSTHINGPDLELHTDGKYLDVTAWMGFTCCGRIDISC